MLLNSHRKEIEIDRKLILEEDFETYMHYDRQNSFCSNKSSFTSNNSFALKQTFMDLSDHVIQDKYLEVIPNHYSDLKDDIINK